MANVGSWEVDLATGERAYSEQFCRIFGIDPDEPDAVPDVERLQAMEKRARETLEPATDQFRFPLPDGSTRTIVSRVHVVFNEQDVWFRSQWRAPLLLIKVRMAVSRSSGEQGFSRTTSHPARRARPGSA